MEIPQYVTDEQLETMTGLLGAKCPQMVEEFKRLQKRDLYTFCSKQLDYGTENISLGSKLEDETSIWLSLCGIFFRMNDKISRIKNLVVINRKEGLNESVDDSFLDLSVYGVIARIVSNKKWGK